jgi:hypothetical protein
MYVALCSPATLGRNTGQSVTSGGVERLVHQPSALPLGAGSSASHTPSCFRVIFFSLLFSPMVRRFTDRPEPNSCRQAISYRHLHPISSLGHELHFSLNLIYSCIILALHCLISVNLTFSHGVGKFLSRLQNHFTQAVSRPNPSHTCTSTAYQRFHAVAISKTRPTISQTAILALRSRPV